MFQKKISKFPRQKHWKNSSEKLRVFHVSPRRPACDDAIPEILGPHASINVRYVAAVFATKTVLGGLYLFALWIHMICMKTATNMEFLKWSYHDFPYLRFQTHCAQQSLLLFSPQDGQRSDSWTLHQFFMVGKLLYNKSKMLVLASYMSILGLLLFLSWKMNEHDLQAYGKTLICEIALSTR